MTIDGKQSSFDTLKAASAYSKIPLEQAVKTLAARRGYEINYRTFRSKLDYGTARFADVKHLMEIMGFRLKWESVDNKGGK